MGKNILHISFFSLKAKAQVNGKRVKRKLRLTFKNTASKILESQIKTMRTPRRACMKRLMASKDERIRSPFSPFSLSLAKREEIDVHKSCYRLVNISIDQGVRIKT